MLRRPGLALAAALSLAPATASAAICLRTPELFDDDPASVSHPRIPSQVASAAALVPPEWKVEKRITGDLDGDGRPDLVLLLRGADPRCRVTHDGLGTNPLDTNPRLLIVALATPGGHRVVGANDRLIPRHVSPTVEDPLAETGGVAVTDGALFVELNFFASAGTYSIAHRKFTFRWRDGQLVLVGFDGMEGSRSTLEFEDRSANYLTGRMKITKTVEDRPAGVRWINLPKRPLRAFAQMDDGWAFEP